MTAHSDAMQELMEMTSGTSERKVERENKVLALSNLMTNEPMQRSDIRKARPTEEPDTEDKDLEIVRNAVELWERIGEVEFKKLVLTVT